MNKKIQALYDAGKVDRAIHLLIKEIDAHPQKVENYLQLSAFLLEQGSPAQAQKLLEQAQHLVKRPRELNYNLAVCYYTQGKFKRALSLLDQIPNDDLTLYQKALVYLKLNQSQKALAFALTIKKRDDKVNELLGDIWLSLGESKRAEQSYSSIPVAKRTAKIYFLLGVSTLVSDRSRGKKYFAQAKKMDQQYYRKARNQYAGILKMIKDRIENND